MGAQVSTHRTLSTTEIPMMHDTLTNNGKTDEPWMQRYSTFTFEQLHNQIYSYIDRVISQPINQNHPFIIWWNQLTSNSQKYPMKARMRWLHMQLNLGIDDLAQYKEIPPEHTEIRNIINRHSTNTNGYSALHDIMECIHPLQNPDATLHPSLSADCMDIHEWPVRHSMCNRWVFA